MADRVVRRGGFARVQRRKMLWLGYALQTAPAALAANTKSIHGCLNAAALALRPFTVTRVVGSLYIGSDQNAATELAFGALGLVVVTDEAVAAGAGSVPGPYGANASDWMMNKSWAQGVSFSSAVGFQTSRVDRFDFDQKGQRKVDIGQDLIQVIENASALNGAVYVLMMRVLVKLH